MTATLEHPSPSTRALVVAAVVPILVIGVVVSAVLVLVAGIWGLLAGLVVTAVAALLRARSLSKGIRAQVLGALDLRPASLEADARLVNLADGLSATSGVPVPDLFVLDDPGANMLLVGESPDAPALVVTTGLLGALDRIQLEGVVARAFAELRAGGLPASSVAVNAVARPQAALARGGAGALTFRSVSGLLAAGYSAVAGSDRDILLDRAAVALTRYPPGLLAALEEIEKVGTSVASAQPSTAHLWLADPGVAVPGMPERSSLELRIEALRLL